MSELLQVISGVLLIVYYWLESMVLFFIPLKLKAKDIRGELVLVTGAGSGIGRATAIKFAKKGCNLVLWDVNIKGNEETASMIREAGSKAYPYEVDVTNSDNVYKTAAQVKKDAGVVTIVVNNAGIVVGKNILDLNEKEIRKVFDVNALAHFWVIKAFLPDMFEKDHGHLVSVSSMAGLAGAAKLTDYCASKFAAVGLIDSLQVELHSQGRKNIHVTTICPFYTNTGMFNGATAKLFKNLEPDFVGQEIVNSVLCNKSVVIIPRFFHILYHTKILMPARAILALHDVTGGSESMNGFTGKNSKKIE